MDMQDKLLIEYPHRKDNNIEINLKDLKKGTVLFSFSEFEDIYVSLDSTKYTAKVECLGYYENNSLKFTANNILNLENNVRYQISKYGNYEIGYIPSNYHIIFEIDNKEIDCLFSVTYNSEVSETGMGNVIERINNFINGLTIDFFNKQPVNNIITNSNNNENFIYEILSKYSKRLTITCERILNNLSLNLIGIVEKDNYEKKQNNVSIRKNILKKDDKYFNYNKRLSFNNINNIILKKYLLKISNLLEKYQTNINEFINKANFDIEKITASILKSQNDLDNNNYSLFDKKNINNSIKSERTKLNEATKKKEKFETWNNSYNMTYYTLKRLLQCDELIDININNQITYSPSYNLNLDYKFIADLYNELISNINNEHKSRESEIFGDKKSYTIFEIYGFILIQNILKELGFSYKGQVKTTIFDFKSDAEFLYENENKKVKILYDHYCKKYTDEEDEMIVNMNSTNCKPDFVLMYYENDEIKNIMIVEMKYRKIQYLIDYKGTTETDSTLTDYKQLKYKKNDDDDLKGIKTVVLLYPLQKEKTFKRSFTNFIGINVEKNFDESESYIYLKNLIIEIVNN